MTVIGKSLRRDSSDVVIDLLSDTLGAGLYTVLCICLNLYDQTGVVGLSARFLGLLLLSSTLVRKNVLRRAVTLSLALFFSLTAGYLASVIVFVVGHAQDSFYSFLHLLELRWIPALCRSLLYGGCITVLGIILTRVFQRIRETQKNTQMYLCILICLTGSIIIESIMSRLSRGLIDEKYFLILCGGVICSLLFALRSIYLGVVLENERLEKEMLHRLNYEISKGYGLLADRNEALRTQSHDFRNHMLTILNMKDESIKEYVRDILQTHIKARPFNQTGNRWMDAVIQSKIPTMEEHNISFSCNIRMPETLQLSPTDICSIVSNQLDNAIEACEKIEHADRWITYTTDKSGDIVLFICENSIEKNSVDPAGPLRSTKKDSRHLHGYGMKSIQNSAERNGGTMLVEVLEDRFISKVMLQLNSDKTGNSLNG